MGIEDDIRAGMKIGQQAAQQQAKQLTQQQEHEEREREEARLAAQEEAAARTALVAELHPLIRRFLDAAEAKGCAPEQPLVGEAPPEASGWLLYIRSLDLHLQRPCHPYTGLNILLEASNPGSEPAMWICWLNRFPTLPGRPEGWECRRPWQRWIIGAENEAVCLQLQDRRGLLHAERELPFAIGLRMGELDLTF
ncbi:hypothetical protein ACQPZF_36170 [Actinosynnema sp. CS-041913]|uniref:hypothetical protein n=1 Tax=Actinosynnema sp. CS-041913 TaxID=3239917 RepID=UPI003D8F7101